ncbi:hypothetical protein ACWYXK_08850 [Janthinobacterium lividum]|uniref:hypothetical protein n=1 Tax=Janthinobacterium TaxID=29580 RepID=UPI000C1041DC|nr:MULTISPECIES: hypothetical protein [Janthinobacterium]PHV51351.1 hypothetical protein CSQ91_09670 [Janthinobacterium sp. BJB301]QKY04135.1 hypothetical protein G3257_18955 [Janthinobacterium lividum]QKY09753.1 hypothetical protein G8765_19660 [Janthinobacterium lividum]
MNDWHLVNLFIPTLLPLVFLSAFFLFDLSTTEKARANPLVAIKDGQLSWAGLGMCVNGLYELQHPAAGKVVSQLWSTNTFWLVVAVLVFHALIAAAGPVFPTKKCSFTGGLKTLRHYRVLLASAILTIAAGWLYSDIHLTTQG